MLQENFKAYKELFDGYYPYFSDTAYANIHELNESSFKIFDISLL